MRSINSITLLGFIGVDPVIGTRNDGKPFMRFPLATNRTWICKDGAKGSKTDWHQCVIWTPTLIQVMEGRMFSGDPIYLEGHMEYRKYLKEGVEVHAANVVCEQIVLLAQQKKELVPSGDSPYENDFDSGW